MENEKTRLVTRSRIETSRGHMQCNGGQQRRTKTWHSILLTFSGGLVEQLSRMISAAVHAEAA